MARYYVNDTAQKNGDHEVHRTGCTFMPINKTDLGEHVTCETAVTEAKKKYPKTANGCYYCSNNCHTS